MATARNNTIIKRGNTATCKSCGMTGLEWVNTRSGWVMIPQGSSDFTETMHALTQSGCTRRSGATATPTASGDVTIVQYDDSALRSAMDALTDDVKNVQHNLKDSTARDTALQTMLATIDNQVTDGLTAMRRDINALSSARTLSVVAPWAPTPTNLGRVHNMTMNAITMLAAIGSTGVLMLKGEAASAKSSAGRIIADALGVRYNPFTCGPTMTDTDFLGYFDATGKYVDTWRIWEHYREDGDGGLTNFDEFDNNGASGVTTVNNLTSNSEVGFPIRLTKRHERSYFMACGNTFGRGADERYIGRQQLDGATLSRLVYIPWETDRAYIAEAFGMTTKYTRPQRFPDPESPRAVSDFSDWADYVFHAMDVAESLGIEGITARAYINGAKLLTAGVHTNYQTIKSDGLVEYATMWAHMSEQDADTVRAAL